MALKKWDETLSSGDCVDPYTEWNDMVTYIKRSGSCAGGGHILYNDDDSSIEWFRFKEWQIQFRGFNAILASTNNTFYGIYAGNGITTKTENVLLGSGAGENNNFGACVFVGAQAGYGNSDDNNIGIGKQCLYAHSGERSVGIGTRVFIWKYYC